LLAVANYPKTAGHDYQLTFQRIFIMKKQQLLSLALGSAFAVAAISPAVAANPFEASKLDNGYQLAQADMKKKDGKCGEAKCGADKKKEASCGGDKKKDATCGGKK
jgi:uncharacterized low-complexity protein